MIKLAQQQLDIFQRKQYYTRYFTELYQIFIEDNKNKKNVPDSKIAKMITNAINCIFSGNFDSELEDNLLKKIYILKSEAINHYEFNTDNLLLKINNIEEKIKQFQKIAINRSFDFSTFISEPTKQEDQEIQNIETIIEKDLKFIEYLKFIESDAPKEQKFVAAKIIYNKLNQLIEKTIKQNIYGHPLLLLYNFRYYIYNAYLQK